MYDLWSDGYGTSVPLLNDNDEYPVAGYSQLLCEVYNAIRESGAKKLLDVGFGTGILTNKLYMDGLTVYGIDASEQMVLAGRARMPDAVLIGGDYSMGMLLSLVHEAFDLIVSTYAFHHLDHCEKVSLLGDMLRLVPEGGKVIIGDLAFETREEMKNFRQQQGDNWLYEDMYMVYEEAQKDFAHVEWKKISKCAGIITITK